MTSEITVAQTTDNTKNRYRVTLKLLDIDGREDAILYESNATGEGLYLTKQKALLNVVRQLYQNGIIEANTNSHNRIVKHSYHRQNFRAVKSNRRPNQVNKISSVTETFPQTDVEKKSLPIKRKLTPEPNTRKRRKGNNESVYEDIQ